MEKRFQPSKKRLEKARKEGNVAKSQHLSSSVGLVLGLIVCLYYLSISWVDHKILLQYLWTEGFNAPLDAARIVAAKYFILSLKLVAIIAAVNLTVEFFQVGLHLESGLIGFKFKRIDPLSGAKKIFENLKNSWLVVLRYAVLTSYIVWFFYGLVIELTGSLVVISDSQSARAFAWMQKLILSLGSLLILTALLDYAFQRRKWFKSVGMSYEDLKRENKDDEGDPYVRAARRAQHQELLRQDLVRRIRSSKVIVVERKAIS